MVVGETDRPVVALVLAGGTGSRLYPASRSDRPKQFLSLLGEDSLLARTVDRARDVADEVFVSTRPAFAADVPDHAPDAEVVVEPAAKDTGPALVYATHRIRDAVGDCVVVVLPSDHRVGGAFADVMRRGARVAAETDALVTFGVEPTRPDTGYGYIEPGASRGDYAPVAAFHEKPDAETARAYVDAGHYWNAGIFAWTPDALLAAARDSPLSDLVADLAAGVDAERAFEGVPAVSVDYGVMERTANAVVVPASFEWDDLGSWDAFDRVRDGDGGGESADDGSESAGDDGTVSVGDVTVRTLDAADNVVAGDDVHVSLVGVSDLAVVSWDDRVLVVPKDRAQDVRTLVDELKRRGEF